MAIKALGNVTVSYGGTDITQYCSQADLSATIERLDVTNLASTAKESIAGDAEWTIAISGSWATAFDTAVAVDAVTPGTARTVVIAFDGGASTVTYTWTSKGEIQDYKITAATGAFLGWSATLSLSGAPNRAVA
jgi:galactokinase/mevalonate kinase-like predicted kinase